MRTKIHTMWNGLWSILVETNNFYAICYYYDFISFEMPFFIYLVWLTVLVLQKVMSRKGNE